MKNTLYLYGYVLLIVFIVFLTLSHNALTFENGAPEGRSGGPANNYLTCGDPMLACHNPSVVFLDGLIQTNIGEYGYLPDSVYTITATIEHEEHNVFGFQLSPENNNGQFIGNLIKIDNDSQLKMVGNYITHTTSGVQGEDNSKSWTFEWQAPQAGKGKVTFYAAFNAANGDGTAFGDYIFTSKIAYYEKGNTNILYHSDNTKIINVFPKPAGNYIHIELKGFNCRSFDIELINSKGIKVMSTTKNLKNIITLNTEKISPGMYFLLIEHCGSRYVDKIWIL